MLSPIRMGKKEKKAVGLLNEYHTQIGERLYHICEFSELMERNGATYEAKQQDVIQTKEKAI